MNTHNRSIGIWLHGYLALRQLQNNITMYTSQHVIKTIYRRLYFYQVNVRHNFNIDTHSN